MSHSKNCHQRASTSDIMVTPSSSTSVRKRSFLDSSEPKLNDPNFRTSCKKRFLRLRQNPNNEPLFAQTPQRNIDVLRDVVRDELMKCRQQYDQEHTALDSTHHDLDANDDSGDAAMAVYNNDELNQLQSRQMNVLPRANHYLYDDELYDLLLEMEHELNDSIATNGYNIQTELPVVAQETSAAVMTDWEEEIYYMSTQKHEEDAVQELIMEYYNED